MPAFFCDRSFVVYGIKTPVSHSLSRPPRLNVRGFVAHGDRSFVVVSTIACIEILYCENCDFCQEFINLLKFCVK